MTANKHTMSVEAGGLYVGDAATLLATATRNDPFRQHFGTPYRRAKSHEKGLGIVVDSDDGLYEVMLEPPVGHNSCARRLWRRDDLRISIGSGRMSICDVLCILARDCEKDYVTDGRRIDIPMQNGCYGLDLEGYIREGTEVEEASHKLLSEKAQAELTHLQKEYVFGRISESEYNDARRAIETDGVFVVYGLQVIAHTLSGEQQSHDPEPPEFELCVDPQEVREFVGLLLHKRE